MQGMSLLNQDNDGCSNINICSFLKNSKNFICKTGDDTTVVNRQFYEK